MMPRSTAVSLLALFVCHLSWVDAFSTGAGGCDGGMAAVGGMHLDDSNGREVRESTLAQGAIEVSIGSQILSAATTTDVPIGKDLVLSVIANDIQYKGLLVRLEASSGVATAGALMPGANTQNAIVCTAPIVGITHTDNSEKNMATGAIRFDEEVLNVALDVTVVFENSAVSAYVYSRLLVNFRATPVGTPAAAPVATTSAPVAPSPIASPTERPTVSPVLAPVVSSIPPVAPTPIDNPTDLPTSTPVLTPVVSSTPPVVSTPVDVPTDLPTSTPVLTPVVSSTPPVVSTPVDVPTDRPTSAPLDFAVPARSPVFTPVFVPSTTDEPDSIMPSVPGTTVEPTHEKISKGKMSGGKMMMMGKMMKGGKMMRGKGEGKRIRGKDGMTMGKVEDVFMFNEEYEEAVQDDIDIRSEPKDETHSEALHVHKIDHIPYVH
jgi:hypothetical protein